MLNTFVLALKRSLRSKCVMLIFTFYSIWNDDQPVTAVTIRFLPEGAAKLWGVAGTTVRTSATSFLRDGAKLTFRRQRLRIDARTQVWYGRV
jgi:hypothetical protein